MNTLGSAGSPPLANAQYTTVQHQEMADEMLAQQMARLDPDQEASEYELAIQLWAAEDDIVPNAVETECIVCDDRGDHFLTTCEHSWCTSCLNGRFRKAAEEESLFPPRCCEGEIQLSRVERLLEPTLVEEYGRKAIEFRTSNRIYCHGCRKFIPQAGDDQAGDVAKCPPCGLSTCNICGSKAHEDECPEDTGLQQLLKTADEEGWRRCLRCRRMIELRDGCNHMTCECGDQFCHACGRDWSPKTCECPQYPAPRAT